jgi:hypothetical protein
MGKEKSNEENSKTSEGEKSVKVDMVAAFMNRFVVGAALASLIVVHMEF